MAVHLVRRGWTCNELDTELPYRLRLLHLEEVIGDHLKASEGANPLQVLLARSAAYAMLAQERLPYLMTVMIRVRYIPLQVVLLAGVRILL